MLDDLIDIKEASRLTGYSEVWLRILANRGIIVAEKVGNAWALSRRSLMSFMERQKQGDGRFGPRSKARAD